MFLFSDLTEPAQQLAISLKRLQLRIVFAESCTAGMVSAALASVPGISRWHCGSAVTYQEETKTQWLDVSPEELRRFTAVSQPVTESMAAGVLQRTPHAHLAVAVTGHLGPAAPVDSDGIIFVSILRRQLGLELVYSEQVKLSSTERIQRQVEAASVVFKVSDSWLTRNFEEKNS